MIANAESGLSRLTATTTLFVWPFFFRVVCTAAAVLRMNIVFIYIFLDARHAAVHIRDCIYAVRIRSSFREIDATKEVDFMVPGCLPLTRLIYTIPDRKYSN